MTKSFKCVNRLIALIIGVLCCSCSSDKEFTDMCFVGDSLVARWDLQASFPTAIVENHGVSGSGIEYLESLAGKFEGQTVVIISGTNDLSRLTDDDKIKEYSVRYLSAINDLNAATVYLYSIFPRGEQFSGKALNPVILKLNSLIEDSLSPTSNIHYVDVYDSMLYKDLLNPQYSYDGLHLNEYGYALITNALTSDN